MDFNSTFITDIVYDLLRNQLQKSGFKEKIHQSVWVLSEKGWVR